MRPNKRVGLVKFESAVSQTTANVYDFPLRQTESHRRRRVKALEHENGLLMRVLSETRTEILRLQEFLAAP
jgi:hypothetical protein